MRATESAASACFKAASSTDSWVRAFWGYLLGGFGSAIAMLDPLANAVGDPELKDKVTSLLQSNPQVLGYLTIGISVITIAARLRSIAKGG